MCLTSTRRFTPTQFRPQSVRSLPRDTWRPFHSHRLGTVARSLFVLGTLVEVDDGFEAVVCAS